MPCPDAQVAFIHGASTGGRRCIFGPRSPPALALETGRGVSSMVSIPLPPCRNSPSLQDGAQVDALSTYLEQIAAQIRVALKEEDVVAPDDTPELFVLYALLAKLRGTGVSAEDVHDAWSAWKILSGEPHAAVVPYKDLDQATQARDEPYAAAIRRVASTIPADESPASAGDSDVDLTQDR